MRKQKVIWIVASALALIVLIIGLSLLSKGNDLSTTPNYDHLISSAIGSVNRCPGALRNTYGSFAVPKDRYSVYVKLNNKPSSKEPASLYAIGLNDSACHKVGQAKLANNRWAKIGNYSTSHGLSGSFSLVINDSDGNPRLTQPSILLVSNTSPACQPTTACQININAKALGTVNPIVINGKDEPLFVYLAINPKQDKLVKVNYYVDSKFAYTTRQPEDFNKYYIPNGEHTLNTVRLFESGQSITTTKHISNSDYSLKTTVFGALERQRGWVRYFIPVAIFLCIVELIIRLIHFFHRKSRWKRDHNTTYNPLTPAEQLESSVNKEYLRRVPTSIRKVLHILRYIFRKSPVVIGLIILIFAINTYVIRINKVDGNSMESTFENGDVIAVNEIGRTISDIFGTGYTPKRGDIVVFHRNFDKNNPVNLDSSEMVVKRVIGLPGERVAIKAGVITIYNKDHPSGFQPDSGARWQKTARLSANLDANDSNVIDIQLKAGQIFVVGDNRSVSIDSRSFGPIDSKDVIGNVFYKL